MMRFEFFKDEGAFTKNKDGYYFVNADKMAPAIDKLVDKIQTMQGEGDYEGAKAWIAEDGKVSPELQADLDRLNEGGIPVDIVFEQGMDVMGLEQ
jgi:hypothetical protein